MIEIVFSISLVIVAYVYICYPILIFLLSTLIPNKYEKSNFLPPVSIVIAAYNEEKSIASKIENTLDLDYPGEKFEIIVGSDGSTDRTNEIVKSFEDKGIRFLAFEENRGKTITQNDCVNVAKNDIIVFMDAASLCNRDALMKLVSNFTDSRVGVVAGKVQYITSTSNLVTKSQGIYWRYEQVLKKWESRLGWLVGVDGPLYAIRKDLYRPLQSTSISDLITPVLARQMGYSVVLEPEAVTYEQATSTTLEEHRTRRRLVLRGLIGFTEYPELLNLFKNPVLAWQILSHKILRWLVGIFFVSMLTSSVLLMSNPFYFCVSLAMLAFLVLALIGYLNSDSKNLLFIIPYYFTVVNWSALLGILDYLMGKRLVSWTPVRN